MMLSTMRETSGDPKTYLVQTADHENQGLISEAKSLLPPEEIQPGNPALDYDYGNKKRRKNGKKNKGSKKRKGSKKKNGSKNRKVSEKKNEGIETMAEETKRFFDDTDTDNDGYLSKNEFYLYKTQFSQRVVDDDIRMFNDANCDEDYIRDTHQGYIEYLEQFCCLDKNRDRRISLEEI